MISETSKCPKEIPETTFEVLKDYVLNHRAPGGFLTAVLCNDLRNAVSRADNANYRALGDIVRYIYCHCPSKCWGSEEKVDAWLSESSRWRGLQLVEEAG